jgi:AAA ATPase-like protein
MARNPYQPGVGTTPPYLADREEQIQRFRAYLRDFPDKRRNVRLSGLRGVGKTVLLKEYRAEASERDWVVIRRDLTGRLCDESDFATAIADDLHTAILAFSNVAKLKALLSGARQAVGEVGIAIPGGPTVTMKPESAEANRSILEDRLKEALIRVGRLAAKAQRGVVFLYDEAHMVFDRPARRQFPLSALLGAFVQAQDEEDPPLPVMLVVSGLPSLTQHLQAARSHAERLFRAEELGNLGLNGPPREVSKAALALIKPAEATGVRFQPAVAEQIAKDVDGYPYFIQKYGEALWDAADAANVEQISARLYASTKTRIQDALDAEFFEGRYMDATAADRLTLRVAASLGGERFEIARLSERFNTRKPNATQQSVNRIFKSNHIYRVSQGVYAYTAPLFGDFIRRKHPRQEEDR